MKTVKHSVFNTCRTIIFAAVASLTWATADAQSAKTVLPAPASKPKAEMAPPSHPVALETFIAELKDEEKAMEKAQKDLARQRLQRQQEAAARAGLGMQK